ncbi:MAG: tetratricopeptide repeat protein, partial [Desulfatiglandales bacterium]
HSSMGFLLAKMGKFDEAIEALNKALQIAPDNVPALERLGFAYREKGEMGKAFTYFAKALRQKPPDIRAILLLAEVYLIIGEENKAKNILSQAINSSKAKVFLSFIEQIVEDDNILQIRPDMDVILKLLSQVYKEKGAMFKKNSEYCLNMMKRKDNKKGR